MSRQIYLDHAAATPVRKEAVKAMKSAEKYFANPGSTHDQGKKAKGSLEESRETVLKIINGKGSIIFTSGGTESINLALKGIAFANKTKGNHIITSKIEHKAVLETCRYLETQGFEVTYIDVDKYGRINLKDLEKAITARTILISIMYVNNEIGTIQPVKEIAAIAKKHKILFYTDACQAGNLDLDVQELGIDLLTLNSNKIYGPKGVGLLYVKEEISLQPLIHGGGQESGSRSGTENVTAIAGFSAALELAQMEKDKENKRLQELSYYFVKEVQKNIPNAFLNGHPTERLSNNVHLSFEGVEAETVLSYLNQKGIFASAGSACAANIIEPSHVLKAMRLPEKLARGSIRFTFGKETTKKDIDIVVKILTEIISSLRKIG
ncbi:MAG: cysteine desulfurase family protein [Nanoarchaeota archaeon]